jgi:hypothetical protein
MCGTQASQILISQAALEIMGVPEYVRVKVNPERRMLLVYGVEDYDPAAVRLHKSTPRSTRRNRLDSSAVLKAVETMTGRALDVVNLTAMGSASKTMKNAVIFDFSSVNVFKPLGRGKRSKKNGKV